MNDNDIYKLRRDTASSVGQALVDRVPYTDAGMRMVENIIRDAIARYMAQNPLALFYVGVKARDWRAAGGECAEWVADDWVMWCTGFNVEAEQPEAARARGDRTVHMSYSPTGIEWHPLRIGVSADGLTFMWRVGPLPSTPPLERDSGPPAPAIAHMFKDAVCATCGVAPNPRGRCLCVPPFGGG